MQRIVYRLKSNLLEHGRRLLRRRSVSMDYQALTANIDTVELELKDAWKDASIPSAQRTLVQTELNRMYRGDVISVYRSLAEAIRLTGCEDGLIVEVGCASGYYREVLQHLLGHAVRYIGLDYSVALVAEAQRHYGRVGFMTGDATRLPLIDAGCDVLVSGCVILHIPDYQQAIIESARASREWVIFHRTPVVDGPTLHFTKTAYGVKCLEVAFGERELLAIFAGCDLEVVHELVISQGVTPGTPYTEFMKTYVCRKRLAV
jgi:SAM-dependent methyltransferase